MFSKTINFIKKIFLGKPQEVKIYELNALRKQRENVLKVWNNRCYKDFGIERIVRLLCVLSLYLFPGLYIRHISGKWGTICRKISVEFYVLFKLILPIVLLGCGISTNLLSVIICVYLGAETIHYLLSLIFLREEFTPPISYRRSVLALFLNYLEVTLDFAVIYSYLSWNNLSNFSKSMDGIQSVYFSFVSSTTVGYGDISPVSSLAMGIVMVQIILFLVFIGLFLSYFTSKIGDTTYYNQKNNNKKHRNGRKILPRSIRTTSQEISK